MDTKRKIVQVAGFNPKFDHDQAQYWTNKQIYQKGINKGLVSGRNDIDVKLSGTARFLWGFCLYMDLNFVADPDLISLTINEDKAIDQVVWWNFNGQGAVGNIFKGEYYYPVPRLLYGTDSITLTWEAVNAKSIYAVFFTSNDVQGTPNKVRR